MSHADNFRPHPNSQLCYIFIKTTSWQCISKEIISRMRILTLIITVDSVGGYFHGLMNDTLSDSKKAHFYIGPLFGDLLPPLEDGEVFSA